MLLTIAVVILLYYFLIWPLSNWSRKGVPQISTLKSLAGNWCTVFRWQCFPEVIQYFYNQCPDTRYSGMYQFYRPILIIRDPDLIKQILTKDYQCFVDHVTFIPTDVDPLWSRNVVSLTGQKWKDVRTALTSTLTSGKLKSMYDVISNSAKKFIAHLENKNGDLITADIHDLVSRFNSDLMFAVVYGEKANSLEERNSHFYQMAKEAGNFNKISKNLKLLVFFGIPKIYNLFNLKFYNAHVGDFFKELTYKVIKDAEESDCGQTDIVSLIVQARKGINNNNTAINNEISSGLNNANEVIDKEITNDDISANCLNILATGTHSVTNMVCFTFYELAMNPNIQQKLREEIESTVKKYGSEVTYEVLMDMQYMDMVVSEVLRKWPIVLGTDRTCNKSYTIQPTKPGETPVHLEKGSLIWFPIFGLHRDAQFYPDPDRFDPNRFSKENKQNMNPYAFLPFGLGPRSCIANKFSVLIVKTLLYYTMTDFEIVPVSETRIPIELSKISITLLCEGKVYLGFKRITKIK